MNEAAANFEQPCTLDCPAQELLYQKIDYLNLALQELRQTKQDLLSTSVRIQIAQNDAYLSQADITDIINGWLIDLDNKIAETVSLIDHCVDESGNLASECDYPAVATTTRKNAQFLLRVCTAPVVYQNKAAKLDIPVHVERHIVPE